MQQTKQDIFHIIAHITGLGQCGGIGNGKGHIKDTGQGLGKEGFAGTGGSNEQDIALLQLHIRGAAQEDALIVVIDRHGQGNLGFVLADDIAIHKGLDFNWRGQLIHGGRAAARINLVPQKITARADAVTANIHARSSNHLGCLAFPLAAEAAPHLLF